MVDMCDFSDMTARMSTLENHFSSLNTIVTQISEALKKLVGQFVSHAPQLILKMVVILKGGPTSGDNSRCGGIWPYGNTRRR